MRGCRRAALLLAALPGCAVAAERPREDDTRLTLATGFDLSTGDYGAARATDILYAPLSARLRSGPWRLSASTGWLRVDGPGAVVSTAGGVVVAPGAAPRRRDSGFGDVALGAGYTVKPSDKIDIEIGARVKLPIASESKGLGTGKTDVSLGLDVSAWTGKLLPFASLRWTARGDSTAFRLKNGLDASLGAAARRGKVDLFLSYEYSQASSAFAGDEHALFAGATFAPAKRLRLTPYMLVGLSRFAPGAEGGVQLSLRID